MQYSPLPKRCVSQTSGSIRYVVLVSSLEIENRHRYEDSVHQVFNKMDSYHEYNLMNSCRLVTYLEH